MKKYISILAIIVCFFPAMAFAADKPSHWAMIGSFVLDAFIFGITGIILLIIGYFIWEALTLSYSIRKEIVERKNQAVATVTASFIIGMAIIIAASLFLIK